ncbi:histone-like nucleoid-structuring protein Lsr2 [Rhodococcus ruber]|uniref:histone-like nucleoid-structuring protein Lsr2 n=1 Tax=Rhodococcus ruber TaxID=1830 RepID=UPI001F4192FF|nr:Lsr2 family protein [Rhodococcus ruber]MCF8783182.1 Lsr2 family protein [Rhodococcus ruber]
MAEKMIRKVYDDLDGAELNDGEWERVRFSLGDSSYEIDLSNSNVDALHEALSKYIEAGRRVDAPKRGRPAGSSTSTRKGTSGSGRSKEELANIREWLAKNGHKTSARGRVKAELIELYDKEHESKAS